MDPIRRALTAWHVWRSQASILRVLRADGPTSIDAEWEELPSDDRGKLAALGDQLTDAGIGAWLFGEDDYPAVLLALKSPPPILFFAGNRGLLERGAVGICGSRAASAEGLEAARALARSLASKGQVTIAGNAVGVDAEAQGTAIAAGGGVITVLPEGISHFRFRTGTGDSEPSEDQVLVVSQFPPGQPWTVGGAMTRNALIAGMATALVVIEAGERGGTLAAGETALKLGRPVIALEFGVGTPVGNAMLIQ
jgi:DNA processing protein